MSALLGVSLFQGPAPVWLPVLLDVSVKGLVILSAAGAVTLAMRHASAAARHLVWFLAMASLLVLPVLSVALPGWGVLPGWVEVKTESVSEAGRAIETEPAPDLPAQTETAPSEEAPVATTVEPSPAASVKIEPAPLDPALAVAATDELPPESTTPAAAIDETETPAAEESRGRSFAVSKLPWLVSVWALGALVCLAPLVIGRISLWRLSRTTREITGGTWVTLLRRASAEVGLARPVALLAGDRRPMPMIWGIFRLRLCRPTRLNGRLSGDGWCCCTSWPTPNGGTV